MKVIWDDLGRSIKLIVCAMGNYYLASIWIKEKAQIQSYSLKESIIVLIGMMFFIGCNCRTSKTNLHLRMGNKAIFFEV